MEYYKSQFGTWYETLKPIIDSELFKNTTKTIEEKIYSSGKLISPSYDKIFKAFEMCPIDNFKCIVLGQDPYPDGHNATGLAFGIPKKSSHIPPSLKNIMDELYRSNPGRLNVDFDHTLESWAKQGVLLLNSSLTVAQHEPGSHNAIWHPVVSSLLDYVVAKYPYHPLIIFGAQAKKMVSEYTKKYALILYSPHPASVRYGGTGAVGSNVFVNANVILSNSSYNLNKEPIDWITEFTLFTKNNNNNAPY